MRVLLGVFAGLASVVVLLAATDAMAAFSISLDRRFPTSYCPIDNDTFNLTFTAATDRVKIQIQGNNFIGNGWLAAALGQHGRRSQERLRRAPVLTPGFATCFLSPGPAELPGLQLLRGGHSREFPRSVRRQRRPVGPDELRVVGQRIELQRVGAARLDDRRGPHRRRFGARAAGRRRGHRVDRFHGHWPHARHALRSHRLVVHRESQLPHVHLRDEPLRDADADGLTDCAGDCNDADPKMRPGPPRSATAATTIATARSTMPRLASGPARRPRKLGSDFRVTNASFDSSVPSIAWNGIDYGMLWKDSRNGNQEIFFTHMTPAGTKVGGDVSVTGPCGDCVNPRLVWAGTEYGAVWSQGGSITFRRLDRAGAPLGTATPPLIDPAGSSADEPDIVWTGSEYGVVWDQFVGPQQIRFARLDRQGNRVSQIPRRSPTTPASSATRAPAWRGVAGSTGHVAGKRRLAVGGLLPNPSTRGRVCSPRSRSRRTTWWRSTPADRLERRRVGDRVAGPSELYRDLLPARERRRGEGRHRRPRHERRRGLERTVPGLDRVRVRRGVGRRSLRRSRDLVRAPLFHRREDRIGPETDDGRRPVRGAEPRLGRIEVRGRVEGRPIRRRQGDCSS